MRIGSRVRHAHDGAVGTVQAFHVVWDKGTPGESTGIYDNSVLELHDEDDNGLVGPNGDYVVGTLK